MARPIGSQNQSNLNSKFAEDQMELKLKLELIYDAINALDTAVRGTFDLLIDQGLLSEEAEGLKAYHRTMVQLRKLGLQAEKPKGPAQVQCPSCRSMLRVKGQPGDRCEWCGHGF